MLVTVLSRERERSGRFVFWDVATSLNRCEPSTFPATRCGRRCAFSPSGRSFVWLGTRRIATTIEVATGREIKSWPTAGRGLAFAPGDEAVVIGAEKVQFIDPVTGGDSRPAVAVPGLFISRGGIGLQGGKRLSPDGKYLATTQKGAIAVQPCSGTTGWSRWANSVRRSRGGLLPLTGKCLPHSPRVHPKWQLWDAATGEPKRVLASEQNSNRPLLRFELARRRADSDSSTCEYRASVPRCDS